MSHNPISGVIPDALFAFINKHARSVTLLALVAAIGCLYPLSQLEFQHDYNDWLSTKHASYASYQKFANEFGGDNTLLFHFDTSEVMNDAHTIQNFVQIVVGLKGESCINNVIDPISFIMQQNDLSISTATGLERFTSIWQKMAKENGVLRGFLISPDGQHFGLMTSFGIQATTDEQQRFLNRASRVFEEAGFKVNIAGPAYFGQALQSEFKHDLPKVISLLMLIGLIIMTLCFKNLRIVIAVFLSLSISIELALSLYSMAGIRISLLALLLIPLIFCAGLTSSIHLYHRLGVRNGYESIPVRNRYREVFGPSLIAVFTTAIGTLAFLFSDQKAIMPMGWIAPLAIAMTFLMIFVVSPCLYYAFGGKFEYRIKDTPHVGLTKNRKRYRVIGVLLGLGAILSCLALPQLQMNHDAMNYFDSNSRLKQSYQAINASLTGTYPLEIILSAKAGEVMTSPKHVRQISEFEHKLKDLSGYKAATSITNLIEEAFKRKALHQSVLSASDDLITRAVSGIENKVSKTMRRFVSANHQSARISVRFSYREMMGVDTKKLIEEAWASMGEISIKMEVTGLVPLILEGQKSLLRSQLSACLLILVIIISIFIFIFRSIQLIFYAIIINGIPLLYVLGIMGYGHIPFNMINVFVVSVMLGVVVDDSIHILLAYKQLRSIQEALNVTAKPILITSIIISLSFMALLVSSLVPLRQFAILAISAVMIAYLCDRYLLPLMIFFTDKGVGDVG